MSTRIRLAAVAAATAVSASVAVPVAAAAPSAPHSGSTILIETSKGKARCTLNNIATGDDGTVYGTTAGHCLNPAELGAAATKITDRNGNLIADQSDIDAGGYRFDGTASPANPDGGLDDFGWFRLNDNAAANDATISSSPVTGILPVDNVLEQVSGVLSPAQSLGDPVPVTENLVGQIVCKDGSSTGRTCGPVLSVTVESQEVFAFIPATSGDSGAPLTVGGADGKCHIVGTLSNGTPLLFNIFDGTAQWLDTM